MQSSSRTDRARQIRGPLRRDGPPSATVAHTGKRARPTEEEDHHVGNEDPGDASPQLVWLACALAALVLAAGALLIALDANRSNELVDVVLTAASWADLDVFSRQDGIKQFRARDAAVKNALINWGLAAIAWLVVGRVLYRVISPWTPGHPLTVTASL